MALTSNSLRDHSEYRRLAEESRRKARASEGESLLRQSYLDVATSYDKLADTLEQPKRDCKRSAGDIAAATPTAPPPDR